MSKQQRSALFPGQGSVLYVATTKQDEQDLLDDLFTDAINVLVGTGLEARNRTLTRSGGIWGGGASKDRCIPAQAGVQ